MHDHGDLKVVMAGSFSKCWTRISQIDTNFLWFIRLHPGLSVVQDRLASGQGKIGEIRVKALGLARL